MEVLITGVGDAFTRKHFSTSAVIRGPRGLVLLDCPDLIHRVLLEASRRSGWEASADTIDDILLTHLHGDHCNGLESFAFYRKMARLSGKNSVRPRLYCSPPVAKRVWERLAPAMDASFVGPGRKAKLADFFDLKLLRPGRITRVAGLSVQCRFTGHPVPTLGLKISDGRRKLGWSGDTPFEQAHIDWLSECDCIVHESNHGMAHTPLEKLNALPADLRRRIRLIHLPDDHKARLSDMKPLKQGEVLKI